MKILFANLAAALFVATPALADGKVYVQLPDLSAIEGREAQDMLHRVVLANVVSSNCADFAVTDAEWSLLTDAADLLAYGQLKLDTGRYDDQFYKPAFAALDAADTCRVEGPKVEDVLDELVAQGGSRDALPDQEAAYIAWRALMDEIQSKAIAEEAAAPVGKTKVK